MRFYYGTTSIQSNLTQCVWILNTSIHFTGNLRQAFIQCARVKT